MAVSRGIGLKPTMADPNVWIRAEMRPDGCGYYGILLVCVGGTMIISNLGDEVAKTNGGFYKFKEGIQGPPTRYLGANTEKIQTEDGHQI